MSQDDDTLDGLRRSINQVDTELLGLLNRRASLVEEVAEVKEASGGAFYVPSRERSIIDRLQAQNSGPFPASAIRPVFQEIISACLSLEDGIRVAYLGPEATFTHQAVKRHFGTSARALPCGSIPSAFAEVTQGRAHFAVVPVENSSEGVVNHTLDSFVDSELRIRAEIVVNVDHCLLARPGTTEGDLQRVYSHPQGLAQCRGWLAANLPHVQLVEVASTADAARHVQDDPAGSAVASELAARTYGLEVLRSKLQDISTNITRFLVLGDEDEPYSEAPDFKTSMLVVLPDSAGALYRVLRPFAEASINLTKIESRPTRKEVWDYLFFLDLEGHREAPHVAAVIEELTQVCPFLRVLGSYRRADAV